MIGKAEFPPKFTVDTSKVLDLFTGERFYSSADAALREAVLNAIDACGRRASEGSSDYSPEIRVVFNDDSLTVTVADNGDGMDREEVGSLFTKVGSSAADLAAKSDDAAYQAVGEFGIGVVSYFLVSDSYEVHSVAKDGTATGLEFGKEMLDGDTTATEVSPKREERGTTIVLPVKESHVYETLLEKFSHWVRDVEFLNAHREPSGERVEQGGLTSNIEPITVEESPEWLERATIGPPTELSQWQHLDGRAEVDLLYRGVFVEQLPVAQLWGLEGALHVDPKEFKAQLNREGFIGQEDERKIKQFLQEIHPKAVSRALDCVRRSLDKSDGGEWSLLKWVTLWLAIPRNTQYKDAAKRWDDAFVDLKAFRRLEPDGRQTDVAVSDLKKVEAEELYLAPPRLDKASEFVQQAVRVLRAENKFVIQGKRRESNYLRYANYIGESSSELLQYFSDYIPPIQEINDGVARRVVKRESEVDVLEKPVRVRAVSLGNEGSAVVKVDQEVWVNVDVENGRKIVREICDRNEGHIGLWIACLRYAPESASSLGAVLKGHAEEIEHLGIVKRQYLRKMTG